jgi:hypothetical protein
LSRGRPTTLNGKPTSIIETEIDRLKNVVSAIASAIFHRESGYPFHRGWMIYPSGFLSRHEEPGLPDPFNAPLREMLASVDFDVQATPHPQVFQYARYREVTKSAQDLIYRFSFYEGSAIYAVSEPAGDEFPGIPA